MSKESANLNLPSPWSPIEENIPTGHPTLSSAETKDTTTNTTRLPIRQLLSALTLPAATPPSPSDSNSDTNVTQTSKSSASGNAKRVLQDNTSHESPAFDSFLLDGSFDNSSVTYSPTLQPRKHGRWLDTQKSKTLPLQRQVSSGTPIRSGHVYASSDENNSPVFFR
jgi:hypothetical protein